MAVSIVAMLLLVLVYIPRYESKLPALLFFKIRHCLILGVLILSLVVEHSATTTILGYRCGQIPSLGSPYFVKYRKAADTVRISRARLHCSTTTFDHN